MGTTVSKVAVKLAHKLTTHDGSTHTHSTPSLALFEVF